MIPILGFQEAVEKIVTHDLRYHSDAYLFLREVMDLTVKRQKKRRKELRPMQVSVTELLESFRLLALKEFGPMALTLLQYWGVKNSADIGQIVFNLIDAGVVGKTEDDTLAAFSKGFDFEQAFVHPFQPKVHHIPFTNDF
jgi:uncharacterized repeat protein (TIGR04138 family)